MSASLLLREATRSTGAHDLCSRKRAHHRCRGENCLRAGCSYLPYRLYFLSLECRPQESRSVPSTYSRTYFSPPFPRQSPPYLVRAGSWPSAGPCAAPITSRVFAICHCHPPLLQPCWWRVGVTRQQGCTVLSAQGHSEAAAGCEEPTGGGVREGGGSGAKTVQVAPGRILSSRGRRSG